MPRAGEPRDLWLAYLRDYVVVQVGTDPRRYAAALDTPALPIFGPLRATKKAALNAGWKKYRDGSGKANPGVARTPKLSATDLRVLSALDMRIQVDNARELATWGRSLSAGHGVTASALEDATGLSRRAVTAALRHLIRAGKVEGIDYIAEVPRKVGPAGGGAGNFRARAETRQAADPRYRLKGA